MKHYTVTFKPDAKSVFIHSGATILEAAAHVGIILNSTCGGKGTCGKCAVILEPEGKKVFACQYEIQSDLTVTVPVESRFFQQKILQRGIDTQIHVAPAIRKIFIESCPETPDDLAAVLNDSAADHTHRIDQQTADQLNTINSDTGITAVCHRVIECEDAASSQHCYKVICLEVGDTTADQFGVAVDIGTTTVVAKLIDISDGKEKATTAITNPQIKFGDDVITRISFAETQKGLDQLNQTVIDCVNSLIARLCKDVGISSRNIYEIAVAGNTTMSHLFLKYPVKQLGQAPYEAYSTEACDRNANQMAIQINPCGNVHTIENIAGFVGSDTTAVALAVGMETIEEMTLVVDIGTNGELVLGNSEKLYSASCAAGPALEGARIACGSRAVEGAIERVVINEDDLGLDVIGGGTPRSICGSGLIDAIAVTLDLGLIDETGRFIDRAELEGKLSEKIMARLIERDGDSAFVLAHNDSNDNPAVILTQKDIRETQLAKAAIRAGIKLLQKKIGIEDSGIEQILLAGAFGNYIQRESARRIGLLPNVPIEKIHFIGNAAGTGARMVLLSNECRSQSARLVKKIEYIEIAHEIEFQMVFADSLMFEVDP